MRDSNFNSIVDAYQAELVAESKEEMMKERAKTKTSYIKIVARALSVLLKLLIEGKIDKGMLKILLSLIDELKSMGFNTITLETLFYKILNGENYAGTLDIAICSLVTMYSKCIKENARTLPGPKDLYDSCLAKLCKSQTYGCWINGINTHLFIELCEEYLYDGNYYDAEKIRNSCYALVDFMESNLKTCGCSGTVCRYYAEYLLSAIRGVLIDTNIDTIDKLLQVAGGMYLIQDHSNINVNIVQQSIVDYNRKGYKISAAYLFCGAKARLDY